MRLACALIVALLTLPAIAQTGPIQTDTPSISTPSFAVGQGVLQWESLVQYASAKQGSTPRTRHRIPRGPIAQRLLSGTQDLYTTPQLLRYGVGDGLEVRMETDGLAFQGVEYGVEDPSFGFKWNFYRDEDLSLAISSLASIPGGTTNFRSNLILPSLALCLDYQVTGQDSMTFNLAAQLEEPNPRAYYSALATAVASHQFNERLSGYVEGALSGPTANPAGPYVVEVDAGLQVLMTQDWALNMAVFRGLSGVGTNWGAALGFGARL